LDGFTHFTNVDTVVLVVSKHFIHLHLHLVDSSLNGSIVLHFGP
jgi:hypothetical protein